MALAETQVKRNCCQLSLWRCGGLLLIGMQTSFDSPYKRRADQSDRGEVTDTFSKRRARSTATPAKAEKDRDFASVRYCSSLVGGQMLCSRSAAGRHSAIDRQQFRFTCVSANAISDTRHGWQPVSTASCRGRTELRMACYF